MAKEAPAPREDKLKALESARLQIERQFGKGALMQLGENAADIEIDIIPSGSVLLDAALIRLVLGDSTSGHTGLSWSRRTARYEPHRRASAAAATPSRPTIDPDGRFGGSGFSRR